MVWSLILIIRNNPVQQVSQFMDVIKVVLEKIKILDYLVLSLNH